MIMIKKKSNQEGETSTELVKYHGNLFEIVSQKNCSLLKQKLNELRAMGIDMNAILNELRIEYESENPCDYRTLLMHAVREHDLQCAEIILKEKETAVNKVFDRGTCPCNNSRHSAIRVACWENDLKMIKLLLSYKADPNLALYLCGGMTAHSKQMIANYNIFKLLIENEIIPFNFEKQIACSRVFALLCDCRNDIENGNSLKLFLERCKHLGIEVDLFATNHKGSNGLQLAAKRGHILMVRYLLESVFIDENTKDYIKIISHTDKSGQNVLHRACTYDRNINVVKYLLAEYKHCNEVKQLCLYKKDAGRPALTSIDRCCFYNCPQILKFMIDNDNNGNGMVLYGSTLRSAISGHSVECVNVILSKEESYLRSQCETNLTMSNPMMDALKWAKMQGDVQLFERLLFILLDIENIERIKDKYNGNDKHNQMVFNQLFCFAKGGIKKSIKYSQSKATQKMWDTRIDKWNEWARIFGKYGCGNTFKCKLLKEDESQDNTSSTKTALRRKIQSKQESKWKENEGSSVFVDYICPKYKHSCHNTMDSMLHICNNCYVCDENNVLSFYYCHKCDLHLCKVCAILIKWESNSNCNMHNSTKINEKLWFEEYNEFFKDVKKVLKEKEKYDSKQISKLVNNSEIIVACVKQRDVELLTLLLENGANVNYQTLNGATLMYYAVCNPQSLNMNIIETLTKYGFNYKLLPDFIDVTPISFDWCFGWLMIITCGVCYWLDMDDYNNEYFLYHNLVASFVCCIMFLLGMSIDIWYRDTKSKYSILLTLCGGCIDTSTKASRIFSGENQDAIIDCFRYIKNEREKLGHCKVNIRQRIAASDRNTLHLCIQKYAYYIALYLVNEIIMANMEQYKDDIYAFFNDKGGKKSKCSPICYLYRSKMQNKQARYTTFKLFRILNNSNQCNLNEYDNKGWSPIHYMCKYDLRKQLQAAINNNRIKIDRNQTTNTRSKSTPIMIAVKYHSSHCMKILCQCNDIDIINIKIALEQTCFFGYVEGLRVLSSKMMDMENIMDKKSLKENNKEFNVDLFESLKKFAANGKETGIKTKDKARPDFERIVSMLNQIIECIRNDYDYAYLVIILSLERKIKNAIEYGLNDDSLPNITIWTDSYLKQLGTNNAISNNFDKLNNIANFDFLNHGNDSITMAITKKLNEEQSDLTIMDKDILGKGAFGYVWKAYVSSTKQFVAIKLIKRNSSHNDEKHAKSIAREIQALKEINSNADNISGKKVIQLYGYNLNPLNDNQHVMLIFEYAENGNLRQFLRSLNNNNRIHNDSRAQLVKTVFLDILNCVAALHLYGIIHRDLKPENILFDSRFCIKLADLGLSKIFDVIDDSNDNINNKISSLQSCTGVVGSPYYVAPEVLNGDNSTIASDIYSIGIILFELITGYRPFNIKTKTDILIDENYKYIRLKDYQSFWNNVHVKIDSNTYDNNVKDVFISMVKYDTNERGTIKDIQKMQWLKNNETYPVHDHSTDTQRFMQMHQMLYKIVNTNVSTLQTKPAPSNNGVRKSSRASTAQTVWTSEI